MTSRDEAYQHALEELGRRLEARGLVFASRDFFASNGIIVMRPIESPAPEHGEVSPASPPREYSLADIRQYSHRVALYHSGTSWEARVTAHGGPHWIRRAESLDELEGFVDEALQATEGTCPNDQWGVAVARTPSAPSRDTGPH